MKNEENYTPTEEVMLDRFKSIGFGDAVVLVIKGRSYGDSWHRRGGVGAFMMLARKWDRIEKAVSGDLHYDIFGAIKADSRDEGILDDIRDLRRYLTLVEEYCTRDVEEFLARRGFLEKTRQPPEEHPTPPSTPPAFIDQIAAEEAEYDARQATKDENDDGLAQAMAEHRQSMRNTDDNRIEKFPICARCGGSHHVSDCDE